MTLIIFVTFSLDIICILGLNSKKSVIASLTSAPFPVLLQILSHTSFGQIWMQKLQRKILQAELPFLSYKPSFTAAEKHTPSSCAYSSNPLTSLLFLCIPLFTQQCTGSATIFSSWIHHLTFAHIETHQLFLQPFP